MSPQDPQRTGTAVITINAKIENGNLKGVQISSSMPEWVHTGLVLAEAQKVALQQIEKGQKDDSPRIYVPVGPASVSKMRA